MKTPLNLCRVFLLVAVNFGPLARAAAPEQKGLHWDKQEGKHIALLGQAGVIWQFNFGSDLTKPYFHPLSLPGSEPITVNRPADHAWHHGLWFSWVKINGVNYWEHASNSDRSTGETRWRDVRATCHDDFSAELTMQLEYGPQGGETILWESRQIVISPLSSSGQYQIDWGSTFSAHEREVTLACTPIPPAPGGVSWGGYAGLSVRFVERLADRQVHSTEGQAEFDSDGIYRTRSTACDYSGVIAGRDAGIAILNDSSNPRSPSDWYAIRSGMSYLNAAFLVRGPYNIPAKSQLDLRYRVVVHPGKWTSNQLALAAASYLRELEVARSTGPQ